MIQHVRPKLSCRACETIVQGWLREAKSDNAYRQGMRSHSLDAIAARKRFCRVMNETPDKLHGRERRALIERAAKESCPDHTCADSKGDIVW